MNEVRPELMDLGDLNRNFKATRAEQDAPRKSVMGLACPGIQLGMGCEGLTKPPIDLNPTSCPHGAILPQLNLLSSTDIVNIIFHRKLEVYPAEQLNHSKSGLISAQLSAFYC